MAQDLSLEHDDDFLSYGSAQELRHLVNGVLGRLAIKQDTPTPEIAHALIDALRVAYKLRGKLLALRTKYDNLQQRLDEGDYGRLN